MSHVEPWVLIASSLAFSIICVLIAEKKRLSSGLWGVMGFLFGPLAFLGILVIPADKDAIRASQIKSGVIHVCPFCAETVKGEAVVCKHCGRDLPAKAAWGGMAGR